VLLFICYCSCAVFVGVVPTDETPGTGAKQAMMSGEILPA
jgi:hypothetical protein